MNREAWLAERRKVIGGSDAAAACGRSPWQTEYGLWCDKLGMTGDRPPTTAMAMGNLLEDAIRRGYSNQTGQAVTSIPFRIERSKRWPWMGCSLDGVTEDGQRIVECKNVSAYAADEWGDPGSADIPEYYAIQVQHQMAVMDLAVADVAALFAGERFAIYTVPRDEELIAALVTIEQHFWELVESRTPPEPEWEHPSTPRLMRALYGVNELLSVTLPEESALLVRKWERARAAEAACEKAKEKAKAQLLHLMGEAAIGNLGDGRMLTRKTVTRKRYEVAETSYIDFRLRKGKS